jgi:putative ABC transport system permease protein
MLGIIIGVASVILVVGIGQGVKNQISGQLHHYGKDIIVVHPAQIKPGGANKASTSLISDMSVTGYLSSKDVQTVKSSKGVVASAPLTIVGGAVKGENGLYSGGYVIGTSADLSSLLNQSMDFGTFLGEDDMGSNTAVLGKDAAEEMFKVNIPLGHSFVFHGREFVVRGVFNDFNSSPLSTQANFDKAIFIPYDVADQITNNTAPTYKIIAKGGSGKDATTTANEIKSNLDKTHGGQSNMSVLVGNQNAVTSDAVLNLLTSLIAGIAAISLLVGGLGIMNVMMVSVTERMHEIGIRKAIGATNAQILHQFMLESSLLSVIGGVIGIGVAFIVSGLLRVYTNLEPSISLELVLLATFTSLLLGVVFGTIPALQAARKDPIDALRYRNM